MTIQHTKTAAWARTVQDLADLDEKIRIAEYNLMQMKLLRARIAADHTEFRLFVARCKKKYAKIAP